MQLVRIDKTHWAGKELYYHKRVDSTNAKAFSYAKEGCSHGTLVIADAQEAGRGRRGRSWCSKDGAGIYMSLVLRPSLNPGQAPGLTLVAALAVVKAIHRVIGECKCQIKWPNDVVMNGKKLCGILTEMHLMDSRIDAVIVGIGINVHKTEFPEDILTTATSIEEETGKCYSKEPLIEEILWELEGCYEEYIQTGNLERLKEEYEDYLANKGQVVKVLDPCGEYQGIAQGITATGDLIVDTGTEVRLVSSGEVSVRGIYGYV